MFARVRTSALTGVEALPVDVEVDVRNRGKDNVQIIGLADTAVREARERVFFALEHSGFQPPKSAVINLAPAELKKEGSCFDVAIALASLIATNQATFPWLKTCSVYGELALDGRIQPVRGATALAVQALESGKTTVIMPLINQAEARLVPGLHVIAAKNLSELVKILIQPHMPEISHVSQDRPQSQEALLLFEDVWGQTRAKRALLIAACGAHHLLMVGPPGCGKSMLAQRLPSILPPLAGDELLEVMRIHGVAGLATKSILQGRRPYRGPHQSISEAGMVGGGSNPRPGEVSLAHRGVLFLDEFPEFSRNSLEALRAPIEDARVTVSRAKVSHTFPAEFQLIAAMNPCPCGKLGAVGLRCSCPQTTVQKYLARLSGPILDRIDIQIDLEAVPSQVMLQQNNKSHTSEREKTENTRHMAEIVLLARERQIRRQGGLNARMQADKISALWEIEASAYALVKQASEKYSLSARGFIRVLRVARTIADMQGEASVGEAHVAEALSLRCLERLKQYARIPK